MSAEPGKNCREGCKDKSHLTFGDCLRDANINIGNLK